jgi:hypothetical protein
MSSSTPETATSSGLSPDAFSSMFQALNGLRNRPALIAMVGCMFAGVLLFGLFTFLAARLGYFMAFLGGLAWLVAGATGVSAAGVLLMDQAKDVTLRSVNDAIVQGLKCLPKFILLGLVLIAVALVVFLLLALVFFVCKIPVLGPLLFVAVFPLSVVIAGLTVCGLIVCMLLALPAIWEGATITRAIAQALAIARSRLVETLVLLAVVGVLSVLVAFIVFGVLFSGLMPTIGMSASILGGSGVGQMLGMMQGSDFGGGGVGMGGAGYALAAGVGAGLLWALAGSLVSLVNLLGLNLLYLRVTEGLDIDAAETVLISRLDEVKQQAVDVGHKAMQAAERAREQARPSAASTPASASAPAPTGASAPTPTGASAPAPTGASTSVSASAAAGGATSLAPKEAAAPPPPLPPSAAVAPRSAPRELPADATMPMMKKALACPQCLSPVAADDVFCGVCGYKMK